MNNPIPPETNNQDISDKLGKESELVISLTENIVELLAMPEAEYIDFEPRRLHQKMFHPADLS